MTFGASLLQQDLGLPGELARYAGLSRLPFAAFLVYLAMRENLSQRVVWAVIILNALWTADSFLLSLSGWITPTEAGYVFVIVQAVGVAAFAGLKFIGLRKAATVTV